jgi:hypothetical protein
MYGTTSLVPNEVVNAVRDARGHVKRVLTDAGAATVALWGCAETGEVTMQLLASVGIPVAAVYDTYRTGEFCGHAIRDPYRDLDPSLPVIIASACSPDELHEISSYLNARSVRHFFTSAGPAHDLPLAPFKDRHRGRRGFVVGNGPSLNQIDMGRLRDEITFGSNRVYLGFPKWGFHFNYWTIEDKLVADDIRDEWNRMQGPTKFIPLDLLDRVQRHNDIVEVPFVRTPFGRGRPAFSTDPARIYWGGTVTYLLLQLAALMGCNPIYLVGVDCHYVRPDHVTELDRPWEWVSNGDDPNHFLPEYFGKGRKWHDPNVARMVTAYEAAYAYADAHGIQILNATPGSKLDVFPRVDFEQLFV